MVTSTRPGRGEAKRAGSQEPAFLMPVAHPIELKGYTKSGDPIVAGYGIVFGDADLEGDTFTKDTDFGWDDFGGLPPVMYQHGLDAGVGRDVIGHVTKRTVDDVGVWFEAQLDRANKYRDAIVSLVKRGVLGWSSGSAPHLVSRKGTVIKTWPVVELSLTPEPAEPRTLAQFVKTARELSAEELPPFIEAATADDGEITAVTFDADADLDAVLAWMETASKATWNAAYISNLPDSAFAIVLPGGEKDEGGKTVPRALRKLPHHNADGSVDLPHLRNALSRLPQSDLTDAQQASARAHLDKHASAENVGAENKALMGSYERRVEALNDELREWIGSGESPFSDTWVCIIATFDDYVIVQNGDGEVFKLPYVATDSDADEFEFGEPTAMEITAIPDPDGGEDEGKSARLKAGRVMSATNQNQMHTAMKAMTGLHAATCDMGGDCPMGDAGKSFTPGDTPAPEPVPKPVVVDPLSPEERVALEAKLKAIDLRRRGYV